MMAANEISPTTSRATFHSMTSVASTHTKIRLPIEEAVKADFPPGCKVLCFDDEGFRVGVVKNVMVSISLPSQHVFGTFFEVEMKSNAGRDAQILGVFGQTDLRLTPDCPVEVNAEYFGSVFKFAGGSSGKVRGTILGSFEIPASRCNRCAQKDNDITASRKFFYSVRVKFNGMEEAVEAHGVPPEHIHVISSYNQRSDCSTIASEGVGSIVVGGGPFVASNIPSQLIHDNFKENNVRREINRPSPTTPRLKSKRITPEDLPALSSTDQSTYKSNVMDGCFQEAFNESFNVMYHHEGTTKEFGSMLANGNREIYDSETASSFEDRGRMNNGPIASPRGRRGRSSSRQRARSQSMNKSRTNSMNRSRSKSRTRVYETVNAGSSRTVRSNKLPPKEPTGIGNGKSRRQLEVAMSKSSSVDSMNDYEDDNEAISYEDHQTEVSEQEESAETEKIEQQRTPRSGSIKRSSSKKRGGLSRELMEGSDNDEDDEERQEVTSLAPSARSHHDIAKFVRDEESLEDEVSEEDEEFLEDEESISIQSPPKREEKKPAMISTPSSRKKTFGKSWSPSVRSSGEPLDDLQQKNTKKSVNVPASPIITPMKKKVQTFTKAPSPPTVPETSTIEGCYLIFDSASGGTLTLQYSKTVVEGAIGFWAPGKGTKLQGFKFTQKQGWSDLMTGIAGKDYKKKYFNGWCQFVKAANKHKGSVCKWSEHERIELDMYVYYNDRCEVKKIEDGELFDVSNIDAVSCLPKGNSTFHGVKTGEYGTFLNRGDAAGASMAIH